MERPEGRMGTGLSRRLKALAPASPEPDYERLAAYAFARRFVKGKEVADVAWDGTGRGSLLLAGTAASLVGITRSVEEGELASAAYPTSNAKYETAELPALPRPDDAFDVVVALGVLQRLDDPENLLKEARRVLRPDGVLVVSMPDKAYDARTRGSMYSPEAEEVLGRHFGAVRLYRHGAVAGGFVGPYSEVSAETGVRGFRSSASRPVLEDGPPEAGSILAVCGEAGIVAEDPLLLLDSDRRVFEEHQDLARDVGLMWDEVDRMQETEAQSFQDSLQLFKSEVSYLRARTRTAEARAQRLEDHVRNMENSITWRIFGPYRALRNRMAAGRQNPESGSDQR